MVKTAYDEEAEGLHIIQTGFYGGVSRHFRVPKIDSSYDPLEVSMTAMFDDDFDPFLIREHTAKDRQAAKEQIEVFRDCLNELLASWE